jgi:hypothetical protein
VLSDALKEAFLNTLGDSRVQSAWGTDAKAGSPKTAGPPPAGRKTVELKLGMSEAEVVAAAGQPVRRLILDGRTVLQYSDLVVTIVNGKVTDIQVR